MSRFYFDYNATTPLAPSVREALGSVLDRDLKNPSSVHAEGRKTKRLIEECREKTASLLGCLPDEICYTSGATEGNNAVFSSAWETRPEGRSKIVTVSVEHDSVIRPLERLKKKGAVVEAVRVNRDGEIDLEVLGRAVDARTLLVTLMTANNETGILFPVREAAEIAHKRGALFHTDTACAVGKIIFRFADLDGAPPWGADFAVISAHKFHGPKGVGVLIVRKGVPFEPQILGGHQEGGRRAGTENVVGIVGMAAALEYSLKNLSDENKRVGLLRQRLKEGLLKIDSSVRFHEQENRQLPGTLNVAFPLLSGQTLLTNLDLEGVAASYGAACQSGSLEVSRVLLAMGIPEDEAASSIRLSFGRMTTEGEIEKLLEIMKKVIARMKNS